MIVIFEKIHTEAVIPQYQTEGSSGFDFHCLENLYINPGDTVLVKTGLKVQLPAFTELQVRPRSGLALKHGISIVNSPGTIDSDYRGLVQIILINHGQDHFTINRGERIAQMVINKVAQANFELKAELDETERGEGGFGHTGHK